MRPLEKLMEHLEAAALEPMAGKLSFFDLTRAFELTLSEYEKELPRRIAGARVNRREGEAELGTLRRIHELVRQMSILHKQESVLVSARLTAASKASGN